jgi:hypothetical protein
MQLNYHISKSSLTALRDRYDRTPDDRDFSAIAAIICTEKAIEVTFGGLMTVQAYRPAIALLYY